MNNMELLTEPMQRTLPAAPPRKMEIIGEGESLERLLEEFPGIYTIAGKNKVRYRDLWERFLPRTRGNELQPVNAAWCMAYNPLVTVRKSYFSPLSRTVSLDELPYFIVIFNAARDQRPRQTQKNVSKISPSPSDLLQKNIIDRGMIIAEFGDFYLTPNGYPYHPYASLLITKNVNRKQELPKTEEIETWMRFSILTGQYVFFNSPHAGASIFGRLHAQVVDPEGIRYENRQILYPILHESIMKRRRVRPGIDMLHGYGIEVLALRGRDASHRASLAAKKLRDERNCWYNIMINGSEILIVGRNAEKEVSHCIGKKCGAYEMSGVILVGNIEEPLMEKACGDRVVNGAVIFSQLHYEQIASNIANATVGLGGLENQL